MATNFTLQRETPASYSVSPTLCLLNRVHPPSLFIEQAMHSAIGEVQPRSGHEIDDCSGNDRLAGPGQCRESAANFNDDAARDAGKHVAFAGVQTDADGDRFS